MVNNLVAFSDEGSTAMTDTQGWSAAAGTDGTRVVVSCDSEGFWLIGSEAPSYADADRYLDSCEAIGVVTGVNADVSVLVDLLDRPPTSFDEDAFATVWECSLHVTVGKLRFLCPVYEEDDAAVAVPNGWWRLRMALRYEPYGEAFVDESADEQQYLRIQAWLAELTDDVHVKGCDFLFELFGESPNPPEDPEIPVGEYR